MDGISTSALFDELEKIAAMPQARGPFQMSKSVGASRIKLPPLQMPKAPTSPGNLANPIKPTKPAGYGVDQKAYQPVPVAPATANPMMGQTGRFQPPPPTPNVTPSLS